MAWSDFYKQHKNWLAPALSVLLIGAAALSIWRTTGANLTSPVDSVYFTDDDGKTYFADAMQKGYAFDRNGKQAYRAFVYRSGSKEPFVGFVARKGKTPNSAPGMPKSDDSAAPVEVKRPGTNEWMPLTSAKAQAALRSLAPDGALEEVLP